MTATREQLIRRQRDRRRRLADEVVHPMHEGSTDGRARYFSDHVLTRLASNGETDTNLRPTKRILGQISFDFSYVLNRSS